MEPVDQRETLSFTVFFPPNICFETLGWQLASNKTTHKTNLKLLNQVKASDRLQQEFCLQLANKLINTKTPFFLKPSNSLATYGHWKTRVNFKVNLILLGTMMMLRTSRIFLPNRKTPNGRPAGKLANRNHLMEMDKPTSLLWQCQQVWKPQ